LHLSNGPAMDVPGFAVTWGRGQWCGTLTRSEP